MTCTITGILRDAAGSTLPDRLVTFEATRSATPSGTGAALPDPVRVTTDATGLLSAVLLPGSYRARAVSGSVALHFGIVVPNTASASLADVMNAFPVEIGPAVLGQVLTVRDEIVSFGGVASTAATSAAASAIVAEQAADDAEFWAAAASGGGGGGGTVYPSRANFLAATIAGAVTTASVLSNGLVLDYVRDATGTAATTADGGKWSPAGQVYVQHFGANLVPGVTDMTAAFQAAVDWIVGRVDPLGHYERLSANSEHVTVSEPVTIIGASGSARSGGVMFCEMYVTPTPGSTWTAGQAAFYSLLVTNVHFDQGFNLSGNQVLPVGILLDSAVACSVKNCDLHGCIEAHVRCDKTQTGSGRSFYAFNRVRQFDHAEDGYRDPTLRTAIGFDFRIADYVALGNKVYYCRLPFLLTEGPAQLISNHAFDGFLIGEPGDPNMNSILVDADAPNVVMDSNYWDNGRVILHVREFTTGYYLRNNHMHRNDAATSTIHMEIVSHISNATLAGVMLANNTFSGSPTFVNFRAEDGGSFITENARQWRVSGNMRTNGSPVAGLPEIQNRSLRLSSAEVANWRIPMMQFEQFDENDEVTFQFSRAVRFNADKDDANTLGRREFFFGRGGDYPIRITPDIGIDIGFGKAANDGIVGRIRYQGAAFQITPSDTSGDLDVSHRFSYDPADGGWRFGDSQAGFFLTRGSLDPYVRLSTPGHIELVHADGLPAIVGAAEDLDNAIYPATHVWPAGSEPINAPGTGHGVLHVSRRDVDHIFQVVHTAANQVFIRRKVVTWTSWERLQSSRVSVGTDLPTTGAVTLDMAALTGTAQTISVTGDLTFSTTNKLGGRETSLRLVEPGTASRTLTWPAGWTWMGASPPGSISNQTIMVSVRFYGTAENTGVAGWVPSA